MFTGLRRVSVDNKVKYRGRLDAPYVSEPANMIVKFTLSKYYSTINTFSISLKIVKILLAFRQWWVISFTSY